MPPPHRAIRKQLLVERAHQTRFMVGLFAVVLVIVVISSIVSAILFRSRVAFPAQESSPEWVINVLIAFSLLLILELVLAIPVIYVLGLRQSHRIFGPMKRLQRTLEALGNGDFSQRVTLRPGDELQELAASINRMAEHLQRRAP